MVRNTKSSYTIYDHARGAGWILTASSRVRDADRGSVASHKIDIALYYTADKRVETHGINIDPRSNGVDGFLRGYLDIGSALGPYGGEHVVPNEPYADQPSAVKRQRHAPDIYSVVGHADGFSETMAVRAAEKWGSNWTNKTDRADWRAIDNIGPKRAAAIESAFDRADL